MAQSENDVSRDNIRREGLEHREIEIYRREKELAELAQQEIALLRERRDVLGERREEVAADGSDSVGVSSHTD